MPVMSKMERNIQVEKQVCNLPPKCLFSPIVLTQVAPLRASHREELLTSIES